MQLDAQAERLLPLVDELTVALLKNADAPIKPLACGLVPLDIDVFTQDNGRTRWSAFRAPTPGRTGLRADRGVSRPGRLVRGAGVA